GQLAVGGLAALAVPPFALLERGFYKSSAGVFVGCAVLYLSATLDLAVRGRITIGYGEIALWSAFTIAQAGYLASLWGERGPRRARTFSLAPATDPAIHGRHRPLLHRLALRAGRRAPRAADPVPHLVAALADPRLRLGSGTDSESAARCTGPMACRGRQKPARQTFRSAT